MKELTNKTQIIKLSLIYSFLIVILISIPSYFYMKSEIKSYKFQQSNLLSNYALKIQRAIYDFNNSKNNKFYFPKSFNFDSYLYSTNKELIFSTTKEKQKYTDKIKKEFKLSQNRLNAKTLIITKKLDFKEIYLKIILLTTSLGLFIFVSVYLIIRQSIIPYKKANKYLDTFFNDAMHEIKTPLGIIQLNLEILEDKISNSQELNRSLNAVKSLLLTYEDIEYLMKQERVKYIKEEIDLSSFLEQRIELFSGLASSKSITIHKTIHKNIFIFINRMEIQRIIDNTISNAIKYSKEKKNITVTLKEEDKIILSVEDEGVGIKDTSMIFNRYHRENYIKGGFGIGLNIVKNICDKNNIKIEVKSKINQGTTFTYKLNKNLI